MKDLDTNRNLVDVIDAVQQIQNGLGHGELYVAAADAGAITIADTGVYAEATTPVWTAGEMMLMDESAGNGQLTYTGTRTVLAHIAVSISFTSSNSNVVTHWRMGKNGTTLAASEVQRKVGTGSDVGSTALHVLTTMATGDYLSLWARNATNTGNLQLEVANMQAVLMPFA